MSTASPTLAQLNVLPVPEFTAILGGIYEHSPWVAEQAAAGRPYASLDALHAAMQAVVTKADKAVQLAFVRGHPQLTGRLAAQELTASSQDEQRSAGLDRCSAEQIETLRKLNQDYLDRHGFPFIIAVRGLSTNEIIAAMQARLGNPGDTEFATCLEQIGRITRMRLDKLVGFQG